MSVISRRTRARRGSVLVVSDLSLAQTIGRHATRPIVHADDLYDALGTVASVSARNPVDLVLLPIERARPTAVRVLDAIRRLDPAVRVALTTADPARAERERVEAEGFAGWLLRPVHPEAVERLLREDELDAPELEDAERDAPARNARESSRETVEASVTRSAEGAAEGAAVAGEDEDERRSGLAASEADDAERHRPREEPEDRIQASAAPDGFGAEREPARRAAADVQPARTAAEPARAEAGSLGDVDLVEGILRDPAGLPEIALRLVAQESGLRSPTLVESAPSDGRAHAAVVHDGRTLGHLVAEGAEGPALAAWAAWLGPWLALAREQASLREKAYTDALTGACNRRYFDENLPAMLEDSRRLRRPLVLMVFDVDDFKRFNDAYGHEAGDVILVETVRLLRSMVRQGDRVCRIGGDEFAVIFDQRQGPRKPGSAPIDAIEKIVRRFQEQICRLRFPKLGPEAPGEMSVSAGLSTFPWDGHDATSLLKAADGCALQSKRKGKNALTIGPGYAEGCRHGVGREDLDPDLPPTAD